MLEMSGRKSQHDHQHRDPENDHQDDRQQVGQRADVNLNLFLVGVGDKAATRLADPLPRR